MALVKDLGRSYATKNSAQKSRFGIYRCDACGNIKRLNTYDVNKRGHGLCLLCAKTKHGMIGTPEYRAWASMKGRCNDSSREEYPRYGGRGIDYDPSWNNFECFYKDMGEAPAGTSLDRIDNDSGYRKENCRWADRITQNTNQRIRSDNKTGYRGVSKKGDKYIAYVVFNKIRNHLGTFFSADEAARARDGFVLNNNLPHQLNFKYYN